MDSAEARKRKSPAVFLDRDGTLIEEVDFLSKVEDLRYFSFTRSSIARLKDRGYLVIVVTNQSGVARGIFEESAVHSIHEKIQEDLGGMIDAFFYCPHLPDAGCECRKPATGMVDSAVEMFGIDVENSWMIGDKALDVMLGHNAGLRTVLVETGYGAQQVEALPKAADVFARDLGEAVEAILGSA